MLITWSCNYCWKVNDLNEKTYKITICKAHTTANAKCAMTSFFSFIFIRLSLITQVNKKNDGFPLDVQHRLFFLYFFFFFLAWQYYTSIYFWFVDLVTVHFPWFDLVHTSNITQPQISCHPKVPFVWAIPTVFSLYYKCCTISIWLMHKNASSPLCQNPLCNSGYPHWSEEKKKKGERITHAHTTTTCMNMLLLPWAPENQILESTHTQRHTNTYKKLNYLRILQNVKVCGQHKFISKYV